MIDALALLTSRLAKALAVLSGALLVAMTVLACANMLARAVWVPLEGTFEVMGFLGAMSAAFSMAWAQLNKIHISVGILFGRLPRPVRRSLDAAASLASCAFFLLLAEQSRRWAAFLVETGEVSETLHWPFHPFVLASALGCLVMALALFTDFLLTAVGRTKV
ncbi:TRAP transporter small permease [Desulfovibrio sp.]